ncbi:16040_t:CDS:2 [Racocetra persica]|uniref:16040_t:CDS:1 n=1 Tax=Racocetra persica TaxID=160502 RepID=A0ACA9LTI7_9GLOM|nr:16040_t:CDS:2 [Racocetra persica]
MPPKKQQQSEKSKQKEKQKIVEDKTFGLKNKKKSAKVQQQIKQIQNQVMTSGNRKVQKEKEAEKQALADKKAAEQKKKEELAELFKPVQTQKVPFGVDPKTILCQFFKGGQCQKGDKCKFSHDVNVERKVQKIDLYTDARNEEEKKDGMKDFIALYLFICRLDTMDKWDQTKLEQVVTSKHGNPKTTTDIVCKYFLEAIENQKYGWFWECPNGDIYLTIIHRHVVKRHNLGQNLTPVTLESFAEWKKNRKAKFEAEEELKRAAKEAAYKAGKAQGMSGRDLFTFNPDLVNHINDDDDGDEFDLSGYQRDDNNNNKEDEKDDENLVHGQNDDDDGDNTTCGEGKSSVENDVSHKTDNSSSLVTVDDVEVKEDLFAEENLDDLDDDDE